MCLSAQYHRGNLHSLSFPMTQIPESSSVCKSLRPSRSLAEYTVQSICTHGLFTTFIMNEYAVCLLVKGLLTWCYVLPISKVFWKAAIVYFRFVSLWCFVNRLLCGLLANITNLIIITIRISIIGLHHMVRATKAPSFHQFTLS